MSKSRECQLKTEYNFGSIDGFNCLEGQNISVVGLMKVDEKVYKIYDILMSTDVEDEHMTYM